MAALAWEPAGRPLSFVHPALKGAPTGCTKFSGFFVSRADFASRVYRVLGGTG